MKHDIQNTLRGSRPSFDQPVRLDLELRLFGSLAWAMFLVLLIVLALAAVPARAGLHVWSGAVNGRWSVAGNWSSGGVPVAGESTVTLRFPVAGVNREITNDIAQLTVQTFDFTGHGYRIYGNNVAIALNSRATNVIVPAGMAAFLNLPITLPNGTVTVTAGLNGLAEFGGAISGPGVLQSVGEGQIKFTGPDANTFTGGFRLNNGSATLAKSFGVSLMGPVFIGATNSVDPLSMIYGGHHQIADVAEVHVWGNQSLLRLNGYNDTFQALDLADAAVDTRTANGAVVGTLRVNGDITSADLISGDNLSGSIYGRLDLGNVEHGVRIAPFAKLHVHADVGSTGTNGGIVLEGGTLMLGGDNTFSGPLRILRGAVDVGSDAGLGSPIGATMLQGTNTAVALSYGRTVTNEALIVQSDARIVIAKTNAWNGPIQVAAGAALDIRGSYGSGDEVLTLGGPIGGAGRLSAMIDHLILTGSAPNTLSGQFEIIDGTVLHLNKTNATAIAGNLLLSIGNNTNPVVVWERSHQLADTVRCEFADNLMFGRASGVLELNNFSDTIGALDGQRYNRIHCGTGQLVVGGGNQNSAFYGTITGAPGLTNLVKIGSGTFSLGLTQSLSGLTLVSAGTLVLENATGMGAVHVASGAHLSGYNSRLGAVTAAGTGRIEPGNGIGDNQYGTLQPSSFNPGGGIYRAGLGGSFAGILYADQIVSDGPVVLTGVALELSTIGIPSNTNSYTLIKATGGAPIVGTFNNLPEGATFTSLHGHHFRISYQGGYGHDVVVSRLDPLPPPATMTGITLVGPGQMKLQAAGQPGQMYIVAFNSQIDTPFWQPIATVFADAQGQIEYVDTDPDMLERPTRFYRFVIP